MTTGLFTSIQLAIKKIDCKRGVLLTVFFAAFFSASPQFSSPTFKRIGTQEGLSQSSVITINQDTQGLIWVGTRDGLNLYDGRRFTIFRNEASDEHSISNNDILDICIDQEGDVWVATHQGLNVYHQRTGRFKRYMRSLDTPESISNNSVRAVIQSKAGLIIAGTAHGLNFIDKKAGTIRNIFKDDEGNYLNINEIYESITGDLWVGANGRVYKYLMDDQTADIQSYAIKGKVNVIFEYQSKVLVGTTEGLFYLDHEGTFDTYLASEALVNNDIRSLATDGKGNLWVGTYGGISILQPNGEVETVQNDPLKTESLSKNTIKSIFKDQAGSMWVGSYYGGISVWNEANDNFKSIKAEEGGLNYEVISSLAESDRELIIGTEGGGINRIEKGTNKFSYLNPGAALNIKSLLLNEPEETLWAGTFNEGVFRYDLRKNKPISTLNTAKGLSNNNVYDLKSYLDHYLLIGTFGGGLNIYDLKTKQIEILKNDIQDEKSICDNQIRTIKVDALNNIWIGTQDGLSCMRKEAFVTGTYQMQSYFYDPDSRSGKDVSVIFEDKKGMIWVGTKESGLYKLEGDRFVPIEIFKDINLSKTIHAILEDDFGTLWISTNNGILSYNYTTGVSHLFESSDGLVSNEFNTNAALKSSSGHLYFGGPYGISYFQPSLIKSSKYVPKMVLTNLKIANQYILPGDSSGILKKSLPYEDEITLAYDQAIFSIQFALPSYIKTEKSTYAYRMIGLDEGWTYTEVNEASFTIQEPGTYFLEIKGSNGDGIWNEIPTQLTVRVRPAPWRTVWAYLLYVAITLMALYLLFRSIQSRSELKASLQLEHQKNEQEKTLSKLKLQFFTNISHEFRTPLTLILGPLEQIIQEYRGSSKLFKKLTSIEKNANQLLKLINQLMEFRKLENKQMVLKVAEGNIVKFVEEVYLSFKTYAKSQGFTYHFKSETQNIPAFYDRDKMERVLYNLISNALKYFGEKKEVSVEVAQLAGQVQITVTDAGIGMDAENLDQIFERFYQIDVNEKHKKETTRGTGIGLALSKGIIDLHQGQIRVESASGAGSAFIITLPLGSQHFDESQIIPNFRNSESLEVYQPATVFPDETDFSFASSGTEDGEKRPILIVEDNEEIRKFIAETLDHPNYQIAQAANGKQALDVIKKSQPELIVSDVMMPEMDGIALCNAIKSDISTSHIPVILLTARTSLLFKYEGLESGADDYLNKPFNVRELRLKVKNLLMMRENLKGKFESKEVLSLSKLTITSLDEDLFKRAIEIVDDNVGNEFFDIPLFCSELGLSRTMLFTKIKAWTNLTPNEFIQSMRMKRAAQLLEQKKINVSQVSYQVGYKNPKYFSKTFQKHYAMTPTEYAGKFE